MIADHLRKDTPPGSISWRWIEESLKNGELAELKDHPADIKSIAPKKTGSPASTRTFRTPFTAADDKTLMNWVVKSEQSGRSIKGNAIYEELAAVVCIWVRPKGSSKVLNR